MRGNDRMRSALLISATMHALVGVLFWSAASRASDLPKLRVYAVDIVSPPPQELGEFDPLPGAEPAPVEEPEPEPQPEPKPEPPAPKPEPAKVEAAPAPKPKKEEPAPPKKPEPKKPEPPKAQPPKETPKKDPPKQPAAKPTEKTTPSKGASPSPTSAGGENLDVKIEGARFVDPGYLANIQRQINRYFRRPGESRTDVAEVQFYINRDGSVADIEVVRHAGSFAFRVAAMEAVEQAGLNKSFGPLPKEYPSDRLLVSFYFRPAR